MKVKIRRAKKEDLEKINKIFIEEFSKPPYNERWNKRNSLVKLKDYFNKCCIFVLEIAQEIRGFIIGHIEVWDKGNEGFIDEVVVEKKFQGRGCGKNLMEYFVKYCENKECISLGLMCNPKSTAFKIYKKMGFNRSKELIYMIKK